jgi:hypothetical protein
MNGGRRVDVMSTWVKEDQAILHLEEHPRGQFIETTQEIACTLTQEIEEEEEHVVSLSEGDDVEDETYRISPRAGRRAAFDDDEIMEEGDEEDDVEEEPIRQVEEEERTGPRGLQIPNKEEEFLSLTSQ